AHEVHARGRDDLDGGDVGDVARGVGGGRRAILFLPPRDAFGVVGVCVSGLVTGGGMHRLLSVRLLRAPRLFSDERGSSSHPRLPLQATGSRNTPFAVGRAGASRTVRPQGEVRAQLVAWHGWMLISLPPVTRSACHGGSSTTAP